MINQEETNTESLNVNEPNAEQKEKDKNVYFLILNPVEENIDFGKLKYVSNISPSIIFDKTINKDKGVQLNEIVFKFKRKKKKKDNKEKKKDGEKEYTIKYISGDHSIIISFDTKKKSFVYSPELNIGNIYLDNIPEPIEQDIIPLYNKLNIFQEALEENNESNKKEKLFEDSIDLYEKKKKFSLLITLFLKVYENYKELCDKLIEIFYKINDKENTDREKDLAKDLQTFKGIYSKAQEIIEEKKYNQIHFYGILFSYLHYYDKNNFSEMIKKFSEGNADVIYDILIQYYSHFMNPLNQNQLFFDGFIKYVIKKDKKIDIFKRVMKYIEDIEAYLFIINENKNQIFEKYEDLRSKPIELGPSLKLIKYNIDKTKKVGEKTNSDNESEYSDEEDSIAGLNKLQVVESECDIIIKLIEKLIEFSQNERILAIYLKVTFWINLIKQYDIPDWENINNLHKLRELYKKYNNLINVLYEDKTESDTKDTKSKKKKKDNIKNEINGYLERDEFALNLNKNIKGFFELAKDRLTNAEILGTIENYNPFFSVRDEVDKEKYKNKRETYIFDYINFSKITPTFILNFKKWNFEIMFEEIISDYINKITGKIKDIQTFGNVIKLIEVKRINEEKQRDYFRILKEKYNKVIEKDIKNIKDEAQLNKAISIIGEFVSKLFLYEKNNSFIDDKIKKLDDKVKSLIYIELITKYNGEDYQKLKNYIYDIYLNNLNTKEGRDNVMELVKKLAGDEKKFFIYEKLLKKCEFTEKEFFSNHENYKIKTLCELKKKLEEEQFEQEKEEKEVPAKKEEKYLDLQALSEKGNESAKILLNVLVNIRSDLDNEKIIKKDLEKFLRIKRKIKPQKDKEDANK